MIYRIHSVEQDIANKWYARVCISDVATVFLKFEQYPTIEEIQEAAIIYITAQQQLTDGTTE